MKRSIKMAGLGTCVISLLAAGAAQAASDAKNDWYAGLSGDLTWLRHSDTGGGGNVQLGYRFSDFRVEAEAGYHAADGDNVSPNTHYMTYMGNVYYDFNSVFAPGSSGWHVVPYVGAGAGDAAIRYGHSNLTSTFHHHQNEFAWNGMAGLELTSATMPSTDWTLGYRYLGTSGRNLGANNLELGMRIHF